jgi:hypothetical protein
MDPAIPAFSPLRASQPSSFSANSPGEPNAYLIYRWRFTENWPKALQKLAAPQMMECPL